MPKGFYERKVRSVEVEGSLAFITLTKGYRAIIDAEDVPLVINFNWFVCGDENARYAGRSTPRMVGEKRLIIRLHNTILPNKKDLVVDHIDGDGLNNRKSNLRLVTQQQNSFNTKIPKINTSGFKGVSWSSTHNRWRADIKIDGERIFLGRFNTREQAYSAYCEASKVYHGEFGRIK